MSLFERFFFGLIGWLLGYFIFELLRLITKALVKTIRRLRCK